MIAIKASWLPSAAKGGKACLLKLTHISLQADIKMGSRMNLKPEH